MRKPSVSSHLQQSDAPSVVAVSLGPHHHFSKQPQPCIRLLAGQGVEGDAHCGATVQHVYLKRKDPSAPNRMQVHLLQAELLDDLAEEGFVLGPGDLGENILTRGIDLLALSQGTHLQIGEDAVVELTCLRHPCVQIDRFWPGLQRRMMSVLGSPTKYRAGVMAIVLAAGEIKAGDSVRLHSTPYPHISLTT